MVSRLNAYKVCTVFAIASLGIWGTGCPEVINVPDVNLDPIAIATAARSAEVGSWVPLNGRSTTDPDSDPLAYNWQQRSGPSVRLEGRESADAGFIAGELGRYEFLLVVTDDRGGVDTAVVTVHVTDATDMCERQGLYGNGVCDASCLLPDSDCESSEEGSDRSVQICHVPPGNPGNAHTISVGQASLRAHLRHGDTIGACGCERGNAVDCDDGNACTDDACVGGECVYSQMICQDDDPCTIDTCDPLGGACTFTEISCDDGDLCTDDVCDAMTGECIFTELICDDANLCTDDACDSDTGDCLFTPMTCDDGDLCSEDACDVETGACVHDPIDCGDGDPCTNERCDAATGECVNEANLARRELVIRSGGDGGVCGGEDAMTLVTSQSAPAPQPALIAGGNSHAVCDCTSDQWSGDPALLPVTTGSSSDAWGDFVTGFNLPGGFSDLSMTLTIRSDDGAQVFLNEFLVATIDLLPVAGDPAATHVIQIGDPALFVSGENTLRFHVVNTQSGRFGNPIGRGSAGDCMYVQFEARVSYSQADCGLIAWWRMDTRLGEREGDMIPDSSGHGHDLTINGSPTFIDDIVVFNDDATLETPDSDELDLMGDWSVSYWAREDSNDHSPNTNDTSGWVQKVRSYGDSEGGWALASDLSRLRLAVYGSPNCSYDTGRTLSQGIWTRVTGTYDSATGIYRIYFNQSLEFQGRTGRAGNACDMVANNHPVILGGFLESDLSRVPFCKGAMADIRIYDRVLSVVEIASLD